MKLEIKKIGNSTGIILPKELLAQLRLAQGDSVFVTVSPERGFYFSPYDAHHDEVMGIAREAMKEYQDTFKALAK